MKELRTIIFEEREVAQALVELSQRLNRPIPSGTLKGFTLEEGAAVTGTLTVTDDYGADHNTTFNQEEIAAAMVAYCLNRRVPLPRNAQKLITAVDNQIVLALEVGQTAQVRQLLRASGLQKG